MREFSDELDDRLPKVRAPQIGEPDSEPQFRTDPVHYSKPEHAKLPRFGSFPNSTSAETVFAGQAAQDLE
jgi:hypothetical protein